MPYGSPTGSSAKVNKVTGVTENNLWASDGAGGLKDSGIPSAAVVVQYYDVCVPGNIGFGVGIMDPDDLPDNVSVMEGTYILGHDNYGNYQLDDGSVVVCIPAFYYKIGTGANDLAANEIDVKAYADYADETAANAAGYALHRAFKDGGGTYRCFLVFKYRASKLASGTGYIPGSIKNGLPLSTHADHNPIADLTNVSANAYYSCIDAAKAIGGVDGEEAADPQWFTDSRFITGALAMLSMAHGQRSQSTAHCAWYHATYNYPKGCNDDALADTDDGTVIWLSDGYDNCGKTGSAGAGGGAGNLFAKSTHNGQNCGVADVNGLMWEVNIGMTCEATDAAIEDISRADPAQITITGHGATTGDLVMLTGIDVGDWAALDDKIYAVTVVDPDNFTLDGVDSSGFSAAYVVGTNAGAITFGTFYAAKEATAMKDFTSGASNATDHWGATGVAAMMDAFVPAFVTAYPDNGFGQRMGSGGNQVLDEATSGNGYVLAGLGVAKDADGLDTTGTNLFGKDYLYQYIRDQLCVLSAGLWANGSTAGVWHSNWLYTRTHSYGTVGFRCACYPESAAVAA